MRIAWVRSAPVGLQDIVHYGPSTVGVDTLYKSQGKIPTVFLRSCGVPDGLIAFLDSLTGKAFEFYTCFISFTGKDDEFSLRLYRGLQAEGVRCWRWKEDARWGTSLMREVDQAVRHYDKLVIILSEHALKAEPVIREIERALQREQRDSKEVLFPIRLDDTVFSWDHELQADVVRRNVGDFREWEKAEKYQRSFERLLDSLKAPPKQSVAVEAE